MGEEGLGWQVPGPPPRTLAYGEYGAGVKLTVRAFSAPSLVRAVAHDDGELYRCGARPRP